ncbi:hypothetical protein [Terriglobus aquaticus]|uniref:DUF3592 domain-containing protein n=1 Tax=Terriglobus aquaticus TaxID=940139 RepID=A0ABW9KP95_9BACT|nr:hypothetical protein [Terriglobus aquaticus]
MPRINWLVLGIGVLGMLITGFTCMPRVYGHPGFLIPPAMCVLLVLGSTAGWATFNLIREFWIRRVGVRVIGRVSHARSSGFSNNVPSWEVEAVLPDGTTTRLMIDRFAAFTPGETLELIVDPRMPKHAALPRYSQDF